MGQRVPLDWGGGPHWEGEGGKGAPWRGEGVEGPLEWAESLPPEWGGGLLWRGAEGSPTGERSAPLECVWNVKEISMKRCYFRKHWMYKDVSILDLNFYYRLMGYVRESHKLFL